MNRLQTLLKLKGIDKDSLLVNEQKILFLNNRVLRFFMKVPIYSMGETLKKDVIVKNSYGLFYCRKRTMDLHIISDSYEFFVRKKFETLAKKSKVIIDIGANVGKYSILACKANRKAKVYAIEPESENYDILRKNKSLNKLNNLEVLKIALNNKNGKVHLYKSKINKGGHSILKKDKNDGGYEIVEGKKFDSFFKNKLDNIDLLKIDAEGVESEILEGANFFLKNKKIQNIIIEINDKKTRELLESFGYTLKNIQYNNYLAYLNSK